MARCDHPAPTYDLLGVSPIVQIPGTAGASLSEYRCVCDAGLEGPGWQGQECATPDPTPGSIAFYMGVNKTHFGNCDELDKDCHDQAFFQQLQKDLAIYIRTRSFGAGGGGSGGGPALRRAKALAAWPSVNTGQPTVATTSYDKDVCSSVNGKIVCFDPARIQYLTDLELDPKNISISRWTTQVSVRIANVYTNSSLTDAMDINATEAVKILADPAIVLQCAADPVCSARWNIEQVNVKQQDDSSSGFPWWIILLIVLALLICCLCCVIFLCMRHNREELEEESSMVRETNGQFTKVNSDGKVPSYCHKTRSLTESASDELGDDAPLVGST